MLTDELNVILKDPSGLVSGIKKLLKPLPSKSRILLAGSGDNYAAAVAAKETFVRFSGLRAEMIEAVPALSLVNFEGRQPIDGDTLVIVPNLTETASSICDCVKAAKQKGAFVAAIAKAGDPIEKTADVTVTVTTETSFGATDDYLKTMIVLTLLAASLSGQENTAADELSEWLGRFNEQLPRMANEARGRAATYGDNTTGEIIASGADYGAGFYLRGLFYRELGLVTTIEETEDWLHVNFLQLSPEKPVSVVLLTGDNPAWDRAVRTLRYVKGVGRNVTVITDLPPDKLEESYETITLPAAPGWLAAVTSFIPGALLIEAMAVR